MDSGNLHHNDVVPLADHRTAMKMVFGTIETSDRILSYSSPKSLARLSIVSQDMKDIVRQYRKRAFDVNKHLTRFFGDPCAFRSLQARTATVISGSFALQFFDRTYYPESDLDLYVHPEEPVLCDLGQYLHFEGYTYQPYSWQLDNFFAEVHRLCEDPRNPLHQVEDEKEFEHMYDMQSMRAVYTFTRRTDPDDPQENVLKVQIIVARTSPMACLLAFHSTCVMNVITYNAAYSLYPLATFEQQVSLVINDNAPQARAALNKYARRGWRALANPSPLVPYLDWRSFQLNEPRWVCDTHSWVIPLDMQGVDLPPPLSRLSDPIGWDSIHECGWTLRQVDDGAEMDFRLISTTVLRWNYTAGCEQYFQRLLDFFRCQGSIEHAKLPEGKTIGECPDIRVWWDAAMPVLRTRFLQECASAMALGYS